VIKNFQQIAGLKGSYLALDECPLVLKTRSPCDYLGLCISDKDLELKKFMVFT